MAICRPTPQWCSPGRSSKPDGLAEQIAAAIAGRGWRPGISRLRVHGCRGKARFHQYQAGPRGLARAAPRDPACRHGVRQFGDRWWRAGQCRVRLGQPDRPDACGHGRGTVVGDALAALLSQAGFSVTARVLHQRWRRPDRVAGPLAHLRYREALGEAIGEIPEGLVSRRIPDAGGARARRTRRPQWLSRRRGRMARAVRAIWRRGDDAADPRRSRQAGVRHDVFASERGLIASRRDRRGAEAPGRHAGSIYTGMLEPPKGKPPDDWEPRAADSVPRHRLWRRSRPAAEEIRRLLDLFRRRHGLSSGQISPRLRR